MANIFDINNTEIFRAVKISKWPIFAWAKFLRDGSLVLFIIAVLLIGFSFLNFSSGHSASKMLILFLSLYFVFYELNLFLELKIKRPEKVLSSGIDQNNLDNYNLAEFLGFNSAKVALEAFYFCNRKKIPVSSTALFYSIVKNSKDIDLVCVRLGLDPKKLLIDIKNSLEKIPKQIDFKLLDLSEEFLEVMRTSTKIAISRSHNYIEQKDILTALAQKNDLFKKILVEFDLKVQDVENLTLWIDAGEATLEKVGKFWTYENLARQGSIGKDFSTGYTITLDKFSTDWRKIVSKWRYREIIGHQKEIEQAETILAKRSSANVLIVGDPGTGRKSIIEALAQKCYLGTSLPELNNRRVVELDIIMMAAQIPDFEKMEAALEQIFSEVISSGNVILVIDNLENFVGQKSQKAGTVDISGILAKYLPLSNFQFVGITSYDGLHKSIEGTAALLDFFTKVEVSEVSEAETINILQSAAMEEEHHNKVLVLYPSIREIVHLTARYIPSLPFPKKALDVLEEAVVYVRRKHEKIVLPHHIAEVVSKQTEIPLGKMEVKEKETLLNLENLIHNRIINQSEAVKEISDAMRRARMGIASKKRPMGTFLFLGPTGVGKTETAKALSEIYFGSEDKMIRLDMSEFQSVSDIPRLLGAVSPVEMQGLLTTPVRESPFSLVLLDEIEKAHPNILNLLLQVLDEGHITDGQGRKIVFTNTIIICTSNAGAADIFKQVGSGKALEKDKILQSLFDKDVFRPEFINRFDSATIFHPLTKDNLLKIAQLSLTGLQKNLKEKDIYFDITEELKEKIVDLSYKPEYGAREMRRVVQDKVENAIAQALLADKVKKGDTIQVDSEKFKIIVNPIDD